MKKFLNFEVHKEVNKSQNVVLQLEKISIHNNFKMFYCTNIEKKKNKHRTTYIVLIIVKL